MSHVLDRGRLRRLSGGDSALEGALLSLFGETLEKCLARLENAADRESFYLSCHELKGAAANIGAARIAAVCAGAEDRFAAAEIRAETLRALRREAESFRVMLGARGAT